jgi:3-oxoacyl-[acyl-carrier protein] reductase
MVDEPRTVVVTGGKGELAQACASVFASGGWQVEAPSRTTLDVASPASIQDYFSGLSRLDFLLCNAGMIEDRLVAQLSSAAWDRVLTVNLRGAALCGAAAYPLLQKSRGQIVFVGSFVSLIGAMGQSNYAAAKAGLIGLCQSLAQEGGPDHIRSNVVLPGYLPTKFNRHLPASVVEEIKARHVLQRFNTLPEAAQFIFALAQLNHISGQVFQLDSRLHSFL